MLCWLAVPTWNVTLPTADRPWVVGISELLPGGSAPAWSIPLAAAAAIPVTLFLFIEQTITGLLLQQPAANLTKGSCDPPIVARPLSLLGAIVCTVCFHGVLAALACNCCCAVQLFLRHNCADCTTELQRSAAWHAVHLVPSLPQSHDAADVRASPNQITLAQSRIACLMRHML